jgi:hypothetical protein
MAAPSKSNGKLTIFFNTTELPAKTIVNPIVEDI